MRITPELKKKIEKAVETSMRIEGYAPNRSQEIKRQAKVLMEKHHVQVSVPGK